MTKDEPRRDFEDEAEQEAHEAWIEEQEHLASENAATEADAVNAENRPMTPEELREKVAIGLGGTYEDPDVQPVVRLIIQTFLQFCDENDGYVVGGIAGSFTFKPLSSLFPKDSK